MTRRERQLGRAEFWTRMLQFRIPSNPLSRATIWAAGAYALIQGVGIIIGGPNRWTGPSYTVLRAVPFAPNIWGIAAIICAALIFYGSIRRLWRIKAIGLLILSGWSLAFSYGTTAAAVTVATAGTTGGPAYIYICVSTAILVWVDEAGDQGCPPVKHD